MKEKLPGGTPSMWRSVVSQPDVAKMLGVDLKKEPYKNPQEQRVWEERVSEELTHLGRS